MYFVAILGLVFLYKRKLLHFIYFGFFILVGLLPQFILDKILFDLAFFGLARNLLGNIAFSLLGGFYSQGTDFSILSIILLLFFIPIFPLFLHGKRIFREDRKTSLFLLFSFILVPFHAHTSHPIHTSHSYLKLSTGLALDTFFIWTNSNPAITIINPMVGSKK